MFIFKFYDQEKLLDKVWYQSSNIIYSECYDKPDDFKELKVVFKGGATYLYKDVDVNDYIMFKHGDLDGSNGKALNKFIKSKYKYERLPDTDITQLNEELEKYREILAESQRLIEKQAQKEEDIQEELPQEKETTTN